MLRFFKKLHLFPIASFEWVELGFDGRIHPNQN